MRKFKPRPMWPFAFRILDFGFVLVFGFRISNLIQKSDSNVAERVKDPLVTDFTRYLSVERNASPRTLKAYRQALQSFRETNRTPWKKCSTDDFRSYLFTVMKRDQ